MNIDPELYKHEEFEPEETFQHYIIRQKYPQNQPYQQKEVEPEEAEYHSQQQQQRKAYNAKLPFKGVVQKEYPELRRNILNEINQIKQSIAKIKELKKEKMDKVGTYEEFPPQWGHALAQLLEEYEAIEVSHEGFFHFHSL